MIVSNYVFFLKCKQYAEVHVVQKAWEMNDRVKPSPLQNQRNHFEVHVGSRDTN